MAVGDAFGGVRLVHRLRGAFHACPALHCGFPGEGGGSCVGTEYRFRRNRTDHTREYVPLLVYRPGRPGVSLGIRKGFYDVAQSLAKFFGIPAMPRGMSFIAYT